MRRLALNVRSAQAGTRLDQFIASAGAISRGQARRAIDAGGVFLDGRRCKVAGRTVRQGQAVVVHLGEAGHEPSPAAPLGPARILYADEHLVAVDKPPFVASQPTLTTDRGVLPDLVAAAIGGGVTVVHRLDRETSGACVLARTRGAAAALAEAFRTGTPEKTYLALTARPPSPERGRVDAALGPDRARPGRRMVTARGEPAATVYRTLATGPSGASLVECRPETGRTHQIRVHMQHVGAPLLGDARYGGPRRVLETSVPRVMLHAARLVLAHPATGARLVLEAPAPEDFVAVASALVPGAPARPSEPA